MATTNENARSPARTFSPWSGIRERIRKARTSRAVLYGYRAVNALAFALLGVMTDHASNVTLFFAFVVYLPISGFMEWLITENAAEIEKRIQHEVDARVEEKMHRLETDAELYAGAQNFLSTRLRRNTGAVTVLRSGNRQLIGVGTSSIEKLPAINETLRELCDSFSAVCSKTYKVVRPDTGFRATYMEVQGPLDNEKLTYFGWHTGDGNQPKSMSEGKFLRKGEGDAGLAWAKGRAVIEDFKDKRHWKENYENQSSNYKSMVCVPVVKGFGNDMSRVIGVITVDCLVDGFFGKTDDRTAEDHFARLINPYGTYIAFIAALDAAIEDLLARLGGSATDTAAIATNLPPALAAPEASTSLEGGA